MESLPIVTPHPSQTGTRRSDQAPAIEPSATRAIIGHALRMIVLATLVFGLHRYGKLVNRPSQDANAIFGSLAVADLITGARSLESVADEPSLRQVISADGTPLGIIATTSPTSDHIIGYSGPTSLLLVLNQEREVLDTKVLRSFDTPEHLRKVVESEPFWNQFRGLRLSQSDFKKIDGVSGATLTSLAIAESIVVRLATQDSSLPGEPTPSTPRLSLKFPEPLTVDEVKQWVAPLATEEQDPTEPKIEVADAPDEQGRFEVTVNPPANSDPADQTASDAPVKSWVMRTGPLTDSLSGYQGPTELLFRIDQDDRLIDARLRGSFDNQPYVRYTQQERSFWKKFKGRTLDELAVLDLDAEMIDGVSGATMTSIAVAETVRAAASAILTQRAKDTANEELSLASELSESGTGSARSMNRYWNFSVGEIVSIVIALAVIFWSGSSARGNRYFRLAWQVTCFVGIAIVSGNLLSIALFSGWTRGGPSYRLAPGLAALLVVSLAMAIFRKRNVYCDHVCPHGILQQWVRPRKKKGGEGAWPLRLLKSPLTVRLLMTSAIASIALGGLTIMRPSGINLAWLEPFDAYLLGVGVSVSAFVAVVSLMAARLSPLYYCRNACPTGKVLDYVRRDRKSGHWTRVDWAMLAACAAVWVSVAVS